MTAVWLQDGEKQNKRMLEVRATSLGEEKAVEIKGDADLRSFEDEIKTLCIVARADLAGIAVARAL
jgi:hypothetical protein